MNKEKFTESIKYVIKELNLKIDNKNYLYNTIISYMDNLDVKYKTDILIQLMIDNEIQPKNFLRDTNLDIDDSKIDDFKNYFNSLNIDDKIKLLEKCNFLNGCFKKIFNVEKEFYFKEDFYYSYDKNILNFKDNDEMINYLIDNFSFYIKEIPLRNIVFCIKNSFETEYVGSSMTQVNKKDFFKGILKFKIIDDDNFKFSKSIVSLFDYYRINSYEIIEKEYIFETYFQYSKDKENIIKVAKLLYEYNYPFEKCMQIFKEKYEKEYTKLIINNV